MKAVQLFTFLSLFFLFTLLQAQYSVSGVITDAENQPIVGANVLIEGTYFGAASDENGKYIIDQLKAGDYKLVVSSTGFSKAYQSISLTENTKVNFKLDALDLTLDEVLVSGLRANENTATTYTNMSKEELAPLNLGQDVPFVLRMTPSAVVTSDAGAGVGYTGIRIRGSDATRVNISINGVAFNDSESQGTFWVNLPDFASSVNNLQIQRGVGTSANGAGAFGASVNIQTTGLNTQAYTELNNSFGSFNTRKHNVLFGTGLINEKFTLDGRLSTIQSDGFVNRASADLNSYYVSAGFYGKKNILKLNAFTGQEITYQSWYGTPEEKIAGDRQGIQDYIDINFLNGTEVAENLLRTDNDRTFNWYTYDNEVDNYRQDHFQALYSGESTSGAMQYNLGLHYTHGRGYFEQYRTGDDLADYGFNNTTAFDAEGNLIESTDLIRRRWLDNDYYGLLYGLTYDVNDNFRTSLGGAYSRYLGDHFGEVIWAQFAGDGNIRQRYYDNIGDKSDFNIYWKAENSFGSKLNTFVDLQYRKIDYLITEVGNEGDYDFNFFNPKFGLTYHLDAKKNIYASYSIANREPTRSNLTDNVVAATSERLSDIELGFRTSGSKGAFSGNFYYMNYKDQLVLTGNLNDVGATIQENVPESFRMGIELVGGVQISKQLSWEGNLTLSQNKIKEFTLNTSIFAPPFWDYLGDTSITYTDTDISFSPNVVAASTFTWQPAKGLKASLLSKYVGKQYLDNTSDDSRSMEGYFVNDVLVSYIFPTRFFKEIEFNFMINNVLNQNYSANGYTYFIPFQTDGVTTLRNFNHYYPQAGRNFLASIRINL